MARINALETTVNHFVLGESLRPLLTRDMGSSVEIFDTSGPAGSGPSSARPSRERSAPRSVGEATTRSMPS